MPHSQANKITIQRISLSDSFIAKVIHNAVAAKEREFRIKLWKEFAAEQIKRDYALIHKYKEMLKESEKAVQRCWEINAQIEKELKLY